jgi:DNA-binding YbaB/EbfC family protein
MPALARAWQMLLKGYEEVRASPRPLAAADMVLVRLAYAADLPSPAELARRVRDGAAGAAPAPQAGTAPKASREPAHDEAAPVEASAPAQAAPPEPLAPAPELKSFEDVIALAEARRDLKLKNALLEQVRLVHFKPGMIEINPVPQASRELGQELMKKLKAWTGRVWIVAVSDEEGVPPLGAAAFPGRAHLGGEADREARDRRGRARRGGRSQRGRDNEMKNFAQMMKQAQELQGRMAEMQAEMERTSCEGRAGGGMVVMTLSGKGDMVGVKIDPSLLKPEEAEILGDLLVAAHNDAKAKVEEAMKEKMKSLTGGLPLPPGLKLF